MACQPQAPFRWREPRPAALILVVGAAAKARKEEETGEKHGIADRTVVRRFLLLQGWWRPARC